jgi:CHAD domain-containing protein
MAYRFKLSETLEDGVCRIGLQQLDRALTQLADGSAHNVAVHASRKTLKRVRALLRLVRPGLSSSVYTTENTRYRDIGRLLSASRDRQVLVETAARLEAQTSGRTRAALAAVNKRFVGTILTTDAEAEAQTIAKARDDLGVGRAVFAKLDIKTNGTEGGYAVAWAGLARSYAQGLRAMEHAYETGAAEAYHDWRKRVQHHWRHMSLFAPAWPEMFEARIATARQLSALLGEDHDLVMLVLALSPEGGVEATPNQVRLIAAFVETRQNAIRAEARVLGRRLYCESPTAFADTVRLYWATATATIDAVDELSSP